MTCLKKILFKSETIKILFSFEKTTLNMKKKKLTCLVKIKKKIVNFFFELDKKKIIFRFLLSKGTEKIFFFNLKIKIAKEI